MTEGFLRASRITPNVAVASDATEPDLPLAQGTPQYQDNPKESDRVFENEKPRKHSADNARGWQRNQQQDSYLTPDDTISGERVPVSWHTGQRTLRNALPTAILG